MLYVSSSRMFLKNMVKLLKIGVDVNNGFGDLERKIQSLDDGLRSEIEAAIQETYAKRPALAMVDSDKGIIPTCSI